MSNKETLAATAAPVATHASLNEIAAASHAANATWWQAAASAGSISRP